MGGKGHPMAFHSTQVLLVQLRAQFVALSSFPTSQPSLLPRPSTLVCASTPKPLILPISNGYVRFVN